MAEVRRFSDSARVVTEVQPSYRPASAETAEMLGTIRKGFESGVKFLRPAVELEQTQRGEREAIKAFEADSFEMRKPFSIADAAFNKTGERLVTNRAMIELDNGFREALQRADGSMRTLEAELSKLQSAAGGLPDIPGLRTRWLETFERGQNTARRQTTELARRRAVAAQRQAAADAAAAVQNEVQRLALTAGTPEDLAAALAQGADGLAQYGPKGEFTLNGVNYPADPSRSGVFSPRKLQSMSTALNNEAQELFLRADYERSDSPAQWAEEFERSVLAGESPLPPAKALTLLNRFEAAARTDENARRAEEARIERQLSDAATQSLNPYVTAAENGLVVAMPESERTALLESVAGNPRLHQQVEDQLAASDAITAMQGMSASQRVAYIEGVQAQAAATPGMDSSEAAVIRALAPHLKAARSSLTRETVGVSAAEQLLASGGIPTDDEMKDLRARAAGNPTTARAVAVLDDAISMIQSGESLTGVQREEWLDRLEGETAELALRGEEVGLGAQVRLDAIDLALDHFSRMEEMATENVPQFAARSGIALEPFPSQETATLSDVAQVVATRVGQVQAATGQLGNDNPVPLSQSEMELVSDWMAGTNNSQRIAFMETLNSTLPPRQSAAVLEALGVDNPPLLSAGHVAATNPAASRTILAGLGATVQGDTPTNRTAAELVIRPVLDSLAPEEVERLADVAIAYAKGMAVRSGATEISIPDLERGYDIALGADQDGRGGLEDVGRFGTTVLPTGVRGRDVETAIRALGTEDLPAVRDARGRGLTAAELFGGRFRAGEVAGFRVIAPGVLAPLDRNGALFLSDQEGGVFTMNVRDLLDG